MVISRHSLLLDPVAATLSYCVSPQTVSGAHGDPEPDAAFENVEPAWQSHQSPLNPAMHEQL
jgi:hypothetical protein